MYASEGDNVGVLAPILQTALKVATVPTYRSESHQGFAGGTARNIDHTTASRDLADDIWVSCLDTITAVDGFLCS